MRNGIDLRKEFSEFLTDYGHYVLLQRAGKKIRCRCWNEKYQEADSTCMICGGSGYVSRIERHLVRRAPAMQIISRPNLNMQTPTGKMWVDAMAFYMAHNAHPQVGDLIYEVGWQGNKPTHLIQAYRINDTANMRGDQGRIEYWTAAAKGETMNKAFKGILVRSIGPIQNYEIVQ